MKTTRDMGWLHDGSPEVIALLKEIGQKRPPCGFSCGPGWFPIVSEALREMAKIPGWTLQQVKQKFCQLCIYFDAGEGAWQENNQGHERYRELSRLVNWAEARCDVACEGCGVEEAGGSGTGIKLCAACRGG